MPTTLNRRGFLGLLMAGTAGLMLPNDTLWMPSSEMSLPPLKPEAIIGLEQMTKELVSRLAVKWDGYLVPCEIIGDGPLVHQYNVSFENAPGMVDAFGVDADRYIEPIARAFLQKLDAKKLHSFGRLPIPAGDSFRGCTVQKDGIVVRGVQGGYFDHEYGDWRNIVRFDVVAGN